MQTGLDFLAMPFETLLEVEVARVVRIGELERITTRSEGSPKSASGGVGATVLHRLEHASHLAPDVG